MMVNVLLNKNSYIFVSETSIFDVGSIHKLFNGVKDFKIQFIFEPPHDKTNKMDVRPAKTQIRLGIRSV